MSIPCDGIDLGQRATASHLVQPAPSRYVHRVSRPELRIERDEDTYRLFDGDLPRWHLALGPIALATTGVELAASTFLEELVWPAANVAVIGGGDAVYFVALDTGTVRKHIRLGTDQFGHFALDGDDLYVLGWQRVFAIGRNLVLRWISDAIAVDGITWSEREGERLRVFAEMDPPGMWVDVDLDRDTGAELRRGDSLASN